MPTTQDKILKDTELSPRTRALVAETLQDLLEDPDFGLDLSEKAKKRLKAAPEQEKEERISFSEIKERYS